MSRAPTEFEQRVYELVQGIPVGEVVTYAMLAEALGCGSAQAVGQALKRNPFAPQVPCHRVIRTDLSIGGYVGETQGAKLEQKRCLLQKEGVDDVSDLLVFEEFPDAIRCQDDYLIFASQVEFLYLWHGIDSNSGRSPVTERPGHSQAGDIFVFEPDALRTDRSSVLVSVGVYAAAICGDHFCFVRVVGLVVARHGNSDAVI